ncbi:hypothetical protein A2627_00165 [Candidatus Woesebacteria bacterium RIFCSPHIGHO2_01_FULL_39_28]|uniref:Type 4 fimbrial biogenesis protein PilX N-terminal domain-containing protein n=1 Tax=Candidatus Woesebacteria bacterium RIFCSPHIGHO2_01_FULL_39_28 TaxID=1802496 RepID=A0A1F7YDD6_9BACT|nr:MAG: hypothetical protein A2627_00165 [Candidatus Woesebacteria bacterium RIFCSPHIGHO2_01_FULL_39_28]OGM57885.1 MAG: hypothetical protein A3A50_04595 [Candidatus Woesebacteria bacterium RIFCSPLOWO2_01_FULL_38_20]
MRTKGQALLLVLLGMAITLTVVISILSRSVTDVSISSKEDEALRAFSAAEAGVEKALLTGVYTGGSLDGANYAGTAAGVASGALQYVYPNDIPSGESAAVWLVSHNSSGNLSCTSPLTCFRGTQMKVCWGDPSLPITPALEVSIYYDTAQTGVSSQNFASVRVARLAVDPATRTPSDYFDNTGIISGCTINDSSFAYYKIIDFTAAGLVPCYSTAGCLLNVRFRMHYNYSGTDVPQPLGVDVTGSGSTLPGQGTLIQSTGTAGDSTRKVTVQKLFSQTPSIFDYGVFGLGGSLGK